MKNHLNDNLSMTRGEWMEWINELYIEYVGTNIDSTSHDIGYTLGMKDGISGFREYVSREIWRKSAEDADNEKAEENS